MFQGQRVWHGVADAEFSGTEHVAKTAGKEMPAKAVLPYVSRPSVREQRKAEVRRARYLGIEIASPRRLAWFRHL